MEKRRRLSFDEGQVDVSGDKDENYVPRSIYKNVKYKAKGENKNIKPSLLAAASKLKRTAPYLNTSILDLLSTDLSVAVVTKNGW